MVLPNLSGELATSWVLVQSFHSKSALCGAPFGVTLRSRTNIARN